MFASTNDLEPRVVVLEQIAKSMKETTGRLDIYMREATARLEKRFDTVDARLIAIQADQWADFRWLLTAGLGGFAAVSGLIAHTQHWL